jgi:4-amino-4-deoxychorismate lyase
MSLLFETIRIQDGVPQNLEYHSYRLNESRKALFAAETSVSLLDYIQIPSRCSEGIFKCRAEYGLQVEDVTFAPYQPRSISSLRLVEDNSIAYPYKFTDRDRLNELFARRHECEDILIVKDGCITDTSFSNIVFFDGRQWSTPNTPLLKGTMRNYLLRHGTIVEKPIVVADLPLYQKARLINAMLSFESGRDIPVKNIVI